MATKTVPKGKGGGLLKKKVGPLPLPVLVIVGLLGIFIIYKMRKPTSSTTGVDSTATVTPTTTVTPQQAASAGSPNGTSTFDPSQLAGLFPTDYVTQSDLQSQLDSLGSNVGSQIAAITFPPPQITVNVPPPTAPASTPAQTPAPAPQKPVGSTVKNPVASTPTKYFTYKKNVILSHGQTVHFTTGKGYYAA